MESGGVMFVCADQLLLFQVFSGRMVHGSVAAHGHGPAQS